MEWQQGPALPLDMEYHCEVAIKATSFLAIQGDDIREFDTAIAGPTSSEGWRENGRWPKLKTSRSNIGGGWPGCAKIGQKVIITGGYDGNTQRRTEVLNLITRKLSSGGNMSTPRRGLHLAVIRSGGLDKVFALAGYDNGSAYLNTVEEWVEESGTWKTADNLKEKRGYFGAVAVPKEVICPT